MVNRKAPILVLGCMLLAGCQYNPWADRFLTESPVEKDVVGTYVVDADSQKREIELPMHRGTLPVNHSAQILLSADHKARFTRVPESYRGEACSITGQGSWRFSKNDSFSVVIASVVNQEPNSPCKGDFGYELMLYGKRPPYKLHITIGDPDSGDAVQFEKLRIAWNRSTPKAR